jgi:hypothetical protein
LIYYLSISVGTYILTYLLVIVCGIKMWDMCKMVIQDQIEYDRREEGI